MGSKIIDIMKQRAVSANGNTSDKMDDLIGKCSCIICKEIKSARGLHVHIDRTHLGSTKYSSGYNGKYNNPTYKQKIKSSLDKSFNHKLGENKEFNVVCTKCNKEFIVIERESAFPSKEKYYCSRSCANSHTVTKEHRDKTRQSINERNKEKGLNVRPDEPYIKVCKHCLSEFKTFKSKQTFCSNICSITFRNNEKRTNSSDWANYKLDCKFKFNLDDYREEFDFELIEQFGWYKPSNRGNNLDGISRDHMVSVRYGFDNKIDPKIISHPANCKLIKQKENSKKHSKSSISYEELLERIRIWDEKYNK